MKVRAQLAMVMNLDKCIGCHTCSLGCKNVWTNREGIQYTWFNNVETKPGVGYPRDWEDQDRWRGGWDLQPGGELVPRLGSQRGILARIFANPRMPEVGDYYEPFTFDYAHLQAAPESEDVPVARPRSLVSGETIEKPTGSANWEDDLGGPFAERGRDPNLSGVEREALGRFENTFMMYLPRICEHCLNPGCLAVCPSGAIYKRLEDGVVLVDQEKCRGWRMCVSGCPYKKTYYNWKPGKSEKCLFCYPRVEKGLSTVCSHTCVGRIRYLGVVLYDADRIRAAASAPRETDLYDAQLGILLDPADPEVVAAARDQGVPDRWIDAARRSPIHALALRWRIAFPLHPEFRTLPMVWYVPPLSPVRAAAEAGPIGFDEGLPDVRQLRIPVRFLANLFTAGAEAPIEAALRKLFAMRIFMRGRHLEGRDRSAVLEQAGLDVPTTEEMYRLLAIGKMEDRYVLPTAHRELAEDASGLRGVAGFSFDPGGLFSARPIGPKKGPQVM